MSSSSPGPTALWLFAHRALAALFHEDPQRFVATLDGRGAVALVEHQWAWALKAANQSAPAKPPLRYGIDRPRDGLAIVWMTFQSVTKTGEPWHVRFIVRDPDPNGTNGYTRLFMLEHSEYASELAGAPQAIVCESLTEGRHRNWGAAFAPTDEQGFDSFVIDTLRGQHQPAAEFVPPRPPGGN